MRERARPIHGSIDPAGEGRRHTHQVADLFRVACIRGRRVPDVTYILVALEEIAVRFAVQCAIECGVDS
jgi:hypothetical protein